MKLNSNLHITLAAAFIFSAIGFGAAAQTSGKMNNSMMSQNDTMVCVPMSQWQAMNGNTSGSGSNLDNNNNNNREISTGDATRSSTKSKTATDTKSGTSKNKEMGNNEKTDAIKDQANEHMNNKGHRVGGGGGIDHIGTGQANSNEDDNMGTIIGAADEDVMVCMPSSKWNALKKSSKNNNNTGEGNKANMPHGQKVRFCATDK